MICLAGVAYVTEQTKCGVPNTYCDWRHPDPREVLSVVNSEEGHTAHTVCHGVQQSVSPD